MAKLWYPVIDYTKCVECGNCIAKCPHGVYDLAKAPSPVAVNPNNCIDHCHGCANLCPEGAITYVGEDADPTPFNGEKQEAKACCSCGGREATEKKVTVEYLYLDLKTCDRCLGTDKVLDEVMTKLKPVLELAGYSVDHKKVEMTTAKIAADYKFLSSPTIRVNGQCICRSVEETSCGCCSEISGADVDCRVFAYEGATYEVPPQAMLAEAILKGVFAPSSSCYCDSYEMPENLKRFFAGKKAASSCRCGGGCC